MKIIVVKFDMIRADAIVLITSDERKVLRYVEKQHSEKSTLSDEERKANGVTFEAPGCAPIIWLKKAPKGATAIGTLVHEAMHAVRFLLVDHIGMNLNSDTCEMFAYTIDNIVSTTLEKM